MFILHLTLGGCLKAPPVNYGVTADTGGHIAYVLDAALAQSLRPDVDAVAVVTRLFSDGRLGPEYSTPNQQLNSKLTICRIASGDSRYLEKEALAEDLPAFIEAFGDYLAGLARRPDVIHAHFADAAAVAIAAQERFGIPFVYTPHALGIDKLDQGLACAGLEDRIAQERRAIATASAIIVSTRDEAERQLGGYGVLTAGRVKTIAPGIPVATRFDGQTAPLDLPGLDRPDLPILLAIARPVAKKNLTALLRGYAADPGLQEMANVVILAGLHAHASGAERTVLAELRQFAEQPHLRERIALPPVHDAAMVEGLYAKAARGGVFVNPALHEPFGLTLIEAAAAGVPVITTRNGGPAEIIETIGHGLLVDPRDEGAIAAAAKRIIGDPALHRRLSQAGMIRAGTYCWHRYAQAAIETYRTTTIPHLLVCDIDNTLTGCREGADAFAAWRAETALPFVVATGRGLDAARAILQRWRLPEPEAFIVDVGTRLMLPHDGGWRECPDYATSLGGDWDRGAVDAALAPLNLDPQPADTAGPHKISFFGGAADAERIRQTLAGQNLSARVIFSHGRLIDVLAARGGKARAIAAYAARRGWTLADCVAAGDSGNDADMLAACGHAIVVGNADDDLATLPERTGLIRTRAHHAAGVMEGLAVLGVGPRPVARAA